MSNQVYISVVKVQTLGQEDTIYGIFAYDGYGTAHDVGYSSKEELFKEYPTKQSLVDWLTTQTAFDGSEYALVENWTSSEGGQFPVIVEGYLP